MERRCGNRSRAERFSGGTAEGMFQPGTCLVRNILPDEKKVEITHRRWINGGDGEGRTAGALRKAQEVTPSRDGSPVPPPCSAAIQKADCSDSTRLAPANSPPLACPRRSEVAAATEKMPRTLTDRRSASVAASTYCDCRRGCSTATSPNAMTLAAAASASRLSKAVVTSGALAGDQHTRAGAVVQRIHLELQIDALAVLHLPLLAVEALARRIHCLDVVSGAIGPCGTGPGHPSGTDGTCWCQCPRCPPPR